MGFLNSPSHEETQSKHDKAKWVFEQKISIIYAIPNYAEQHEKRCQRALVFMSAEDNSFPMLAQQLKKANHFEVYQ